MNETAIKNTLRAFVREALAAHPGDLEAARTDFLQKTMADAELTVFLFQPWIRLATDPHLYAAIRAINAEKRGTDQTFGAEKGIPPVSESRPTGREGGQGTPAEKPPQNVPPSIPINPYRPSIESEVRGALARNILLEFQIDGAPRRRKPRGQL